MKKQTKRIKKAPLKRKKRQSRTYKEKLFESDSSYFLKLVIVVLLGTLWLKFQSPLNVGSFVLTAVPLGLLLGLIFVKYFEAHQSDRKIWYAVLLVIGILSYFVPAGIVI